MMENSITERDKVGVGRVEDVKVAPAVVPEEAGTTGNFGAGMCGSVLLDELVTGRRDSRDAFAVGINIG
jgi:hypothetical protein